VVNVVALGVVNVVDVLGTTTYCTMIPGRAGLCLSKQTERTQLHVLAVTLAFNTCQTHYVN